MTRFLAITLLVLILIAAAGPTFATSRFVRGNAMVPRWVRTSASQPPLPVADLAPIAPIFQSGGLTPATPITQSAQITQVAPTTQIAQTPVASLGSLQMFESRRDQRKAERPYASDSRRYLDKFKATRSSERYQPGSQNHRLSYNVQFAFVGANGQALPVPEPSGLLALAAPSFAGLVYWRKKRTA